MGTNLDKSYTLVAVLWLIAGVFFGAWLGATENFQFANSHAHMNLVGFVTSAIFGLILHAWPGMKERALANVQFLVYQLGAILLVTGKIAVDSDPANVTLVAIGAVVTVIGVLLFGAMMLRRT